MSPSSSSDGTSADQAVTPLQVIGAAAGLALQLAIGYLGFLGAALSAMNTANCSTRPGDGLTPCGNPVYIEVGVGIAIIGGGLVVLGTLGWVLVRLRRGRRLRPLPVVGLAVQLAVAITAVVVALQSGPLS
ncbi:hypothetical protein [Gordonia hirsuta]|nr:hypothetical protein [Gordonia hirsuta]